jgi:uncharacterized membrane protein
MPWLQTHLRNTFLAGAFAAIPVVVTVVGAIWIEQVTREPLKSIGPNIPGLGLIVALVLLYILGLFVSSLIGKFVLSLIDKLLVRLPGVGTAYRAWKEISLNPEGSNGIYNKVVLVPDESGKMRMLAFCSGETVGPDSDMYCVFVPGSPNPINGRVCFVPKNEITPIDLSMEEAFKLILSSGNYVPPDVVKQALNRSLPRTVAQLR